MRWFVSEEYATHALLFWSDALSLLQAVPVRLSCMHHCADRTIINEVNAQAIKLAFRGGMRIQMHLEDACELRYKLMSYGIPVEGMLSTRTTEKLICFVFTHATFI